MLIKHDFFLFEFPAPGHIEIFRNVLKDTIINLSFKFFRIYILRLRSLQVQLDMTVNKRSFSEADY